MSFADELRGAAAASGVKLDERIVAGCVAHFELLVRWNKTHNLTRITDPREAARKHYLDCLAPLMAWEPPASFVDVGSGAGFPGLLACLAWPTAAATLVEPASKRVSFLRLAADAMSLDAPSIVAPGQGRAERVLSRATFPPGEREQLVAYAAKGNAAIVVWGHPHDIGTWNDEVSTWGPSWSSAARGYQIDAVEERSLLIAARQDR